MNNIHRRTLLKLVGGGAAASFLSNIYSAEAADDKKLLLMFQATGAWDVASFCDPKENSKTKLKITKWSDKDTTKMAGKIPYAPFSNNAEFFKKHYQNMLVINGIENQTNAHGIGVVHSFSGRLARGYPSLTALYAASFGRDLPLPYISMGGFSDGAGILTPVISNGRSLFDYSLQNRNNFDRSLFDAVLFQHGKSSLQELNNPNNIVTNVRQYESYMDSLISSSQLGKLKAVLDANPTIKFDNKHDSILVALLSYKAGLSLSADFSYGGFDSHDHNDERQATNLAELVSGINYAVDKAGELGIADKVTVVVGSDFSRTPWYNASDDGKDHWSIGSFIIIENKAQFGNYVLGATTDNQQQLKINRRSFNIDDNGIQLLPKHVHQELRRYLGIAGNKYDNMFPLNVADEINFLT